MCVFSYSSDILFSSVAPTDVELRVPGERGPVEGDLVAGAGEELEVECVAGEKFARLSIKHSKPNLDFRTVFFLSVLLLPSV